MATATKQKRQQERQPGGPWRLQEAANHLRVSQLSLLNHHKDGKVKLIRFGGRWIMPAQEMERILTEGF